MTPLLRVNPNSPRIEREAARYALKKEYGLIYVATDLDVDRWEVEYE